MPAETPLLRLSGAGFVLPGPDGGACTDLDTFWRVVRDGTSCLSPYNRPGLPLRIAGTVGQWDPEKELPLSQRQIRRSSRAGLMATGGEGCCALCGFGAELLGKRVAVDELGSHGWAEERESKPRL